MEEGCTPKLESSEERRHLLVNGPGRYLWGNGEPPPIYTSAGLLCLTKTGPSPLPIASISMCYLLFFKASAKYDCCFSVPPSDLLLRLGEHDLSTDNEPYIHQERRVQIVASHPQFDPRTFEYDLALLRFYEPVQFQPNIIPICVPSSDENFVGKTAYVTGWGRLYEGLYNKCLPKCLPKLKNNSFRWTPTERFARGGSSCY